MRRCQSRNQDEEIRIVYVDIKIVKNYDRNSTKDDDSNPRAKISFWKF